MAHLCSRDSPYPHTHQPSHQPYHIYPPNHQYYPITSPNPDQFYSFNNQNVNQPVNYFHPNTYQLPNTHPHPYGSDQSPKFYNPNVNPTQSPQNGIIINI